MEDRRLPTTDLFGLCEVCGRGLIHGDCVVCDLPLAAFGGAFSPELWPLQHLEPVTRISLTPRRELVASGS